MRSPLSCTCVLAVVAAAACGKPEASYRPEVVTPYRLESPVSSYIARVKVRLPPGYAPVDDFPHADQSWERKGNPVRFTLRVRVEGDRSERWRADPRICGEPPALNSHDSRRLKIHDHLEQGETESALCEEEDWQGYGERGPTGYWARHRIRRDAHWFECRADMPGELTDGRWDASRWSAAQRAQVLEVCRTFRVTAFRPERASYQPDRRFELEVALPPRGAVDRRAVAEIHLPAGYHHVALHPWPIWRRPDDGVWFYIQGFRPADSQNPPFVPEMCAPPTRRDGEGAVTRQRFYERGADGAELALCAVESRRGATTGPLRSWVRKRIPIDDAWLECTAQLKDELAEPWPPLWTDAEHAAILDVCRSLRVLRIDELPGRHPDDRPRARALADLVSQERNDLRGLRVLRDQGATPDRGGR